MRTQFYCSAFLVFWATTSPSRADDAIPVDALNHIKSATVFLKVRAGQFVSTGTGFLIHVDDAVALIVTNKHVVSMPKEAKGLPVKIEVIFNSGRQTVMSLPAEVVAADEFRDLAVLRVKKVKDLPKPFDLTEKAELTETMPIFLFGFPLGTKLSDSGGNPAINIGKGTVSGLRENALGELTAIQIDGELNPGNSGGPVVDKKGRLIGIVVGKVRGTKIGVAIAGRELTEMLNGRIAAMGHRMIKIENGVAEIEFQVQFIDPLNKISKASVLVAAADSVKEPIKVDKGGKFPPLPNALVVELKIKNQVGIGVVTLKSDQKGPVGYYFQPSYSRGDQTRIYTAVGKPAAIDFSNVGKNRPEGNRNP